MGSHHASAQCTAPLPRATRHNPSQSHTGMESTTCLPAEDMMWTLTGMVSQTPWMTMMTMTAFPTVKRMMTETALITTRMRTTMEMASTTMMITPTNCNLGTNLTRNKNVTIIEIE